MNKKTIVSMSDKNYFELLLELIESIQRFPQSKDIDICVLDAGLTSEQKNILSKKVNEIKKAEWDIEIPMLKHLGKEWLKSQVSRAFIPKYFPHYEKYLWIDCDAWVNDWECINNYFLACENSKLGITQTIGPGYKIMAKVNWLFGKFASIKTQNYKHARASGIKEDEARKLAFAPHLNVGVFSLQKKSECWEVWQKNLKKTLLKGKIFGSEGLAINIAVYIDNVKTEYLPLSHNWIASNLLPVFNDDENLFVEPYIPNNKIGIMHLAAGIWRNNIDMRVDKSLKIDLVTLKGKKIKKSLRFGR